MSVGGIRERTKMDTSVEHVASGSVENLKFLGHENNESRMPRAGDDLRTQWANDAMGDGTERRGAGNAGTFGSTGSDCRWRSARRWPTR